MKGIIDPPSPFATAREWQAFIDEMPDAPEARAYLAEADKRAVQGADAAGEPDQ